MSGKKFLDSIGAQKIIDNINANKKTADEHIESAINAHNADETAHPFIINKTVSLDDRLLALESASGGGGGTEITTNPFAVTFGSLDGTISDGIWDSANMLLGF